MKTGLSKVCFVTLHNVMGKAPCFPEQLRYQNRKLNNGYVVTTFTFALFKEKNLNVTEQIFYGKTYIKQKSRSLPFTIILTVNTTSLLYHYWLSDKTAHISVPCLEQH